MNLLTITDAEWNAYGAIIATLLIAYVLTQLFRADKVTPLQRDTERLMERIGGCPTATELEKIGFDVDDFLDDLKPIAPATTIYKIKCLLYTAMNDRAVELRQKSKV